MVTSHALLSAPVLEAIDALKLSAQKIAHGALAGIHSSSQKGQSIEFAEHRIYTPGDDIKRIDWRAYAKTDRYHIKQFDDETHTHVLLAIDASNSMAFHSGTHTSKWVYAQTLCAAIAYVALQQHDATSLLCAHNHTWKHIESSSKSTHIHTVLHALATHTPNGTTSIGEALASITPQIKPRTTLVLFSDLFDASGKTLATLQHLAAMKHHVSVLHVMDEAERTFPYETPCHFSSSEDTRTLFVQPASVKKQYLQEMDRFLKTTQKSLHQAGVFYQQALSSQDPTQVLRAFLQRTPARVSG
jgi:uncharacterized protein (DUF58 family)